MVSRLAYARMNRPASKFEDIDFSRGRNFPNRSSLSRIQIDSTHFILSFDRFERRIFIFSGRNFIRGRIIIRPLSPIRSRVTDRGRHWIFDSNILDRGFLIIKKDVTRRKSVDQFPFHTRTKYRLPCRKVFFLSFFLRIGKFQPEF